MIDPDRAGCCRPILKVVEIVRVGVDGRVPLLFRERSNLPTLIVRSENPGVPLRGFLFRRGSPTNPVCFRQRRSSLISLLEGNGFEISVPRCLATANSMGAFISAGEWRLLEPPKLLYRFAEADSN